MIDCLPKQRDLDHTCIDKPFAFVNNVIWRTMNFRTSCVWNHAICTEFITSTGDSDIGAVPLSAAGIWVKCTGKIEVFQIVFGRRKGDRSATSIACKRSSIRKREGLRKLQFLGCIGFSNIVDQLGQAVEFSRTAHQVDLWMPSEKIQPIAFCHAADDA